jgi:hypothetical protein
VAHRQSATLMCCLPLAPGRWGHRCVRRRACRNRMGVIFLRMIEGFGVASGVPGLVGELCSPKDDFLSHPCPDHVYL